MIKTLQATVDAANKREATLTQERDNLKEEVDLLRKKLFGSSSEKRTLDIPGQLNFFNEAELEQDPVLAQMEEQDASLPENPTKNGSPEQLMRSVSKESRWKEVSGSFRIRENLSGLRHSAEADRGRVCPPRTGFHSGKTEGL